MLIKEKHSLIENSITAKIESPEILSYGSKVPRRNVIDPICKTTAGSRNTEVDIVTVSGTPRTLVIGQVSCPPHVTPGRPVPLPGRTGRNQRITVHTGREN